MSELTTNQNRRNLRWQLLTTVSALSLVAACAEAQAADKPVLWIELGGQFERLNGLEDPFAPPFTQLSPVPGPYSPFSPADVQKPSIYSYGIEGKVTLRPEGSKWDISLGIRYGRSNNSKNIHQQTQVTTRYPQNNPYCGAHCPPYKYKNAPRFSDVRAKNRESHTVIDFNVGRDVGLGLVSTTASFGVRMANFSSKSSADIIARPNVFFSSSAFFHLHNPTHTDYMAQADSQRSFQGFGPSLSWDGNIPVLGGEDGTMTFDWGVNAAVLFGRQKAKGSHQTIARHYTGVATGTPPPGVSLVYDNPALPHNRSRSVAIPNVGGMAGISFRYAAAKVSFGYRADMFFGAMDMGIDARDTKDRNFYGPFATVSIGLGG